MPRSSSAMILRSLTALFLALSLTLTGCSLIPEKADETRGWNAQKLYSEAKDALNDGNYQRAVELYQKLEARYPFGRYAQQAQIETAYAHYKANEPEEAIAAADRFIRLHPNHPNVDYMYYLKGLATFNEDLGLLGTISNQDLSERDPKGMRESYETFRELIERFPDSKYADDARQRMVYLTNAMARYEVHVADYYLRRGAYLAAANRAKAVLEHFPDSPAQEDALWILMQAYDKLGLQDLRADAERVMRHNFPQSAYFKGGKKGPDKPWWQLW